MTDNVPVIRFLKYFLLFFFLAATVIAFLPVQAQQPIPSDDEVNAIARQLFCPICENTPLDVCPTQACHDWRELIRQMLAKARRRMKSSSTLSTIMAPVYYLNRLGLGLVGWYTLSHR
jgi:cytochrome c-type biogenesis protein CcmH/NrfF